MMSFKSQAKMLFAAAVVALTGYSAAQADTVVVHKPHRTVIIKNHNTTVHRRPFVRRTVTAPVVIEHDRGWHRGWTRGLHRGFMHHRYYR